MGVWLGPRGLPKTKKPPEYAYTGNSSYSSSVRTDGTVDWELRLTSSGTLTFSRVVDAVDVFVVGGGAAGVWSINGGSNSSATGGAGGRGGACITQLKVPVKRGISYSMTIGNGGSYPSGPNSLVAPGNSKAVFDSEHTYQANGGSGGAGANGAVERSTNSNTNAGSTTPAGAGVAAFGSGARYGAGGGGGGAKFTDLQAVAGCAGGATGAGRGGSYNSAGLSASANTGSGGGGGGYERRGVEYIDQPGGAGASGIIIIRNAR